MSQKNEAKKVPQYVAAVSICIGALATGTILGWSANITDSLQKGELNDFKMDSHDIGWAGSSMTLGAMVICFPIGWIADKIGRKPTVLLTTFPFIVGWLLIIFSNHIAMVYTGRFLTGVAGGSFFVTAPLYTSEIAETEIRGRLGTFVQLFVTIGILLAQVLGYAVSLTVYHWILLTIPIIFGAVYFFQPETPVYLIRKGKMAEALKTFERVRGGDYDCSEEVKVIEEQINKEAEISGFWEEMRLRSSKKATLICFMLMVFMQLSGINAVVFYTNEIFTDAGANLEAHWCVIIVGIVQVVVTVFSSWTIDKLGRKILLLTSVVLMALSCLILAIYFLLKERDILNNYQIQDIGFLPILSVVVFIVGYSIGLGPVPWAVCFEIFSPAIKAKCTSAAVTFNWFLAFLVTRFYLNVASAIGTDITFIFFGAVMASAALFVVFVIPETKGKDFAEIQSELEGKPLS